MSTWRRALAVLAATLVSGVLVATPAAADPKTGVPPIPVAALSDICSQFAGVFNEDKDVYRCVLPAAEITCGYAILACHYPAVDLAPLHEGCEKAGSTLGHPFSDVYVCELKDGVLIADCNPAGVAPPPPQCDLGWVPNEPPIR